MYLFILCKFNLVLILSIFNHLFEKNIHTQENAFLSIYSHLLRTEKKNGHIINSAEMNFI